MRTNPRLDDRFKPFGVLEDDPLRAPGLRIPVSLGQLSGLKRKGRLTKEEGSFFADVPYSTEVGLDLTFPSKDDA